MDIPTEREHKRHRRWYRAARFFSLFSLRKYGFTTDVMDLSGPTIILANHLTEADFFMVARAFREPVYFVCGEHLIRSKLGPFLKYICDPITAPRGGVKIGTVRQILGRIKRGYSIAMFPEGCRSFDGETLPVTSATAKLVQKSGAALVTYRIRGGYFIAPRWAYKFRRGHASGKIIRAYSPEELKEMTTEELAGSINCDLYENAYDYQRTAHHKYVSRHLAEGLENYLVLCPKCGKYDTMETKKDRFWCNCCGLGGIYDVYGMLRGDDLPFQTVYDWGKWMEKRFLGDVISADRDVLFEEHGVSLYALLPDMTRKELLTGDLFIYRDRMELFSGGDCRVFPFDNITDKSLLYYGKTFLFTDDSGYYGLTGERFHAWKLDKIFDFRKEQKTR